MINNLPYDERELLTLAASGDRNAFGELYSRYYSEVFGSIAFIAKSTSEAEEIVQEVFVKAWVNRDMLVLVRSFGDYIFTIARNLLFDHMRKARSRAKVENEFLLRRNVHFTIPEENLLYKQYYQTANEALQRITEQKREIFLLRTQEGLTLNEIAEKVGLSRSAVKKHLYGTLEQLKEALRKHNDWIVVSFLLFIRLVAKNIF